MKKTSFYVDILVFLLLAIGISYAINPSSIKKSSDSSSRVSISQESYKNMKFEFTYEEKYPDIQFEKLDMLSKVDIFGVVGMPAKFVRALRFKNITDAVEERYSLPSGLIFAMMIEESNGVDLLPNGRGDGGFGLCHMQPAVAREFGLKIYKNCKGMVCNGKDKRSCTKGKHSANHAKDLKNLIKEMDSNRRKLIEYDDRLHPIKNLDAVGRMLASYRDGKKIDGLTREETAICRYAGKYNYKNYDRDIKKIMALIEDDDFMEKVEKRFNNHNKKLLINGEKGDFEMYIEESQKQNYNYGLAEYKKLPRYLVKE